MDDLDYNNVISSTRGPFIDTCNSPESMLSFSLLRRRVLIRFRADAPRSGQALLRREENYRSRPSKTNELSKSIRHRVHF
jgi:hypothetical protein